MEKCQGCGTSIQNDLLDILKLTKVFKTTKKFWHRKCEKEREDRIKRKICIACKERQSSGNDIICIDCFCTTDKLKYKGYAKVNIINA